MEAPHTELHKLIKAIIQLKRENRNQEAEHAYQRVIGLSGRIVSLLDAAEERARSS